MDDFLVIILTLVIVGVGALGQLKKKKQAAANPLKVKQANDFWDLLGQEPAIPDKREEPDFIEVDKPQTVQNFDISPNQFNAENEGNTGLNGGKTKKTVKLKTHQKVVKGFSLRKAVIYSEILNRKYT